MLRWLLGLSLQFRYLVLAAAAALIVFGGYRLSKAPVDVLPEFSSPIVEIQTEALGLSAAEVEDLVTLNVEELLAGTAWLKTIRSKSITGLSSIILIFEPGTDVMRARQLVQERLVMAHALPNVSKPPVMLQPLSATNRAMIVGLSPKDIPLIDLSVVARWTMTPKLLGVPGVANVSIWGSRQRQLQVLVDPQSLRSKGVRLSQIVKSAGDSLWASSLSFLEAANVFTGGWVDTPNQRLGIQHTQPISTAADLSKVAVAGSSLRLGDVAKVVEEHPLLIGDAIVDDSPGLLLVIEKLPGVNAREVVGGIDAALKELGQGLPGVEIDASIYRATSFLDLSIGNLQKAAAIGFALLVVVIGVLFFAWRAALISLVAILLSLVAAALVLQVRGATINMMVLAGFAIALAAVIDDAVVSTDNIVRRLRQHWGQRREGSVAATILKASAEIRRPMIYATLILILAMAPVFLIDGPPGAFLHPLAVSYVLALLVSMAVATLATPALVLLLYGSGVRSLHEPPPLRWLQQHYEAVVSRSLGAPHPMLVAAGVLVLAAVAALPLLRWSPVSPLKETEVRVSWEAGPGTSLPDMRRVVTRMSQELRTIPGVRNVAAHIGRAITGDEVVGVESGQLWVNIDYVADYGATLATIRETVEGYPGLDPRVDTYLSSKAKEALSAAADPVVVRVQGPDRTRLRQEAERVAQELSTVTGLANVRLEGQIEAPQVEIKVDLAAAGRVGLKPGDIRRAAATVFAGLEVGNLYEQQKVFDVVVWGAPGARHSLTDVRELQIDTPGGGQVRLADVAAVRIVPTPITIEREGVTRRLDIRADISGRNVASALQGVRDRLSRLSFPLEYHAALLGDYEEWRATYWRTLVAALVAAIGIYLLLQACFQSWRMASLLYPALLAPLAGGVLAILIAGGTLSLGSLGGLVAVLGIGVRHGVLLIERCRLLEREEGEPLGPRLVGRGARELFGPILSSALAIGAAFLPLVFLGDAAGLEILHPVAVAVLGGVAASTLVTLFVIPSLYLSFAAPQAVMQEYESEKPAAS